MIRIIRIIFLKHLVQTFCESYGVNKLGAQAGKGKGTRKHRNLCVILGCLAEKMAGKLYLLFEL